jgi:hypothetical protein
MQIAAKVALLDRVLVLYGPETTEARRALRDATAEGLRRTWPDNPRRAVQLNPNEQMGDAVYVAISHLRPEDEAQRSLKTQAANLMVQLAELRSLVQAQAVSSVSKPLLIALVLWLVVIFFGFSLLAPANLPSTLALVAGAFSVACAFSSFGARLSVCRCHPSSQRPDDKHLKSSQRGRPKKALVSI